MKKIALLFLAFSLSSQGATDSFIFEIEKDMNAILRETAVPNEVPAEILRLLEAPQIKCSKIIYTQGRRIVFCTAEIKVHFGENGESSGSGPTICTSLGYLLDKKSMIESHYNPEMLQKCLLKVYSIHDQEPK